MVDNFDQIRSLLNFRSEDEFYFVQILQRKKDHNIGKINGSNNNSRLIKAYYIDSLDKYDFLKIEIIELCKLFGARACINLNKRSYEKMAFQMIKNISDHMMNKEYKKIYRSYNTVCGLYSINSDKNWIIDIDDPNYNSTELIKFINNQKPEGDKLVSKIPSKNGYHLIVKPFDSSFYSMSFTHDIHKNNSTNLYIA